ncbi:DUF1348 family protein [Methylobacter tundripaludum]|uniref:DUF1348 family protein n=1 Tax=Methylobacter tundripaludum TaxID=173365 RepID=UPI001C66E896|nr:DUF1348 family protein [Methylobacter tundripaludum]
MRIAVKIRIHAPPKTPGIPHDPEKIAPAYSIDSQWRNRTQFLSGRDRIVQFLKQKWARLLDYRLIIKLIFGQEGTAASRLP